MGTHTKDSFTICATGDSIITQEILQYEGVSNDFDSVLDLLRSADASVTNLEYLTHNYEPDSYPNVTSGGTYARSPPMILDELRSMGCNLFSTATNHSFDFSHGGILTTLEELERRGLTYAGMGETLFEAAKPGYLETSAGRVAILNATTSFPPGAEVGERSPALHGRPGINPLHVETIYRLPGEQLDQLRQISETAGIEAMKESWLERGLYHNHDWHRDGQFHFGDMKFAQSDDDSGGLEYAVDEDDKRRLEGWIKEASTNADWVILSVHTHQGEEGRQNTSQTPRFMIELLRDCAEAGADVIVGTGPHVLRGIDTHYGSVIFHSLGNFIMQNETVERLPPDNYQRYGLEDHTKVSQVYQSRLYDESGAPKGDLANEKYWQTVVPVCQFDGGHLDAVELYPCRLQRDQSCPQRGVPVLAHDEHADEILSDVSALSEPFGTDVVRSGDRALVTVGGR